MFLRPINTTQLQLVALTGVCSCGGNQLIDHLNKVGGNKVKIRQAVDSCVAIRIILFKKNFMEISCACVCFFYTIFRCFFLLVFYHARVSACSGVIGSVCVPSCKDDGVWLVRMARPKFCHVRGLTCRIS